MNDKIMTFGNPILRKRAVKISKVTPEIESLAESMLKTMHRANGLGLAAQQVGRTEAICVIDVPEDAQGIDAPLNAFIKMPMVLLNPEVSEPNLVERSKEGCLSFPNLFVDVNRPHSCTVSYMGLDGKHYKVRVHGLLARAVMHEVDHLGGVLLVDKLSATQKILNRGKLRRIKQDTLEDPEQQ
jgi:peptide deformylase